MLEKQDNEIAEFIRQSNMIEDEYSDEAFDDACNAWEYAETIELLQQIDILTIHNLLMKRLRPDIAGKYRTRGVFIGGEKKIFRGQEFFDGWLVDLTNKIISSFKLETVEEKEKACKEAHILFEDIHPFEDGNGRTGRIIYNWHRLSLGLPLHIIYAEKRHEYYKWFK